MNVYQIISEVTPPAQTPSQRIAARNAAIAANQQAAAQAASQQAAQQQAAAAQQTAAQQTAAQAKTSADSTARRAAYAAKGLTDKPPNIVRDVGRYARQHEIRYQKNIDRAAAIEKGFLGKVGRFGGWLFFAARLEEPTRDLWKTVSGLEDDYKNGLSYNGHTMTKEDFEAERNFAYGVYETQILLPALARILTNVASSLKVARWIKNAAAAISAPASAGLSIGAALATDAALYAFAEFLGSKSATDYMGDKLMPAIRGSGWLGTSLVDGLWELFTSSNYAEKLEKDKTNRQNQKALKAANTPQEKQAAQDAIDTTTATQTRATGQADLLKQLK